MYRCTFGNVHPGTEDTLPPGSKTKRNRKNMLQRDKGTKRRLDFFGPYGQTERPQYAAHQRCRSVGAHRLDRRSRAPRRGAAVVLRLYYYQYTVPVQYDTFDSCAWLLLAAEASRFLWAEDSGGSRPAACFWAVAAHHNTYQPTAETKKVRRSWHLLPEIEDHFR